MKNKAVLVGVILVAVIVATLAALVYVRSGREKPDRTKTESQPLAKSVTEAGDASKTLEKSQRDNADPINRVLIALTTTQQFKIAVAQHHQSTGRWPASNKDVGLPMPESFRNEVLRSVVIEPYEGTARIRVRFVDATSKERELQQIVSVNASTGYTWQCFSPDFPTLTELAAGCGYRATGK